MFFILVFLSFIWILLFKMFIVGIYLLINGIPMIQCFMSVIWNVCLIGFFRNLFCSIDLVRTKKVGFFQNLLMLSLVLLLVFWLFSRVLIFVCNIFFQSKWEC